MPDAGAGIRALRSGRRPFLAASRAGRAFSRKVLASSTMLWKASSSNQHSLVMRQSSCTSDVTTNGSSCVPRLRGTANRLRDGVTPEEPRRRSTARACRDAEEGVLQG